jgi:glycolate oxidase FAD binding subunit
VSATQRRLGGEQVPEADAAAFWRAVREQEHAFFRDACERALWRLSVRSTAPYSNLGGEQLIEWGGALRWMGCAPGDDGARLRAWASDHGGHATLFRSADKSAGAFHPLAPPLLALHRRLKSALDPEGIFNPRRMYPDF